MVRPFGDTRLPPGAGLEVELQADLVQNQRMTNHLCAVEGCNEPHKARGWCRLHYERWKLHGDPLLGARQPSQTAKFLYETALSYSGNDCLIWPFGKDGNGYASIKHQGQATTVHRLICRLSNGPKPSPAHESAHSCGDRMCVNPRHLRWATKTENQRDRLGHGTHSRGERCCLAKLQEREVLEIRALAGRLSQRAIASQFGVSPSAVQGIVERRRWAWLKD